MRSKSPLILGLAVALLAASGVKLKLDALPRAAVPGSSASYLPTGKFLRAATFGYPSLLADVLFVWAIQYFGNPKIPDKFDRFEHIFSVISDLDPGWIDPYETAAVIALYEAGDVPLALKMFDLGAAKNPDKWIFPYQAGHYAQRYLKDYDLAKSYYQKAMNLPGAPAITKRLFANAAFLTMDLKTAWETWSEVEAGTDDPQIRKIASNHLYRIKATADLAVLRQALEAYREKYGRWPSDLDRLVSAGFLAAVPKDMDGRAYAYDPAAGIIETAILFWKR
jgi:tetratricopeptide (TPR) repeat protein